MIQKKKSLLDLAVKKPFYFSNQPNSVFQGLCIFLLCLLISAPRYSHSWFLVIKVSVQCTSSVRPSFTTQLPLATFSMTHSFQQQIFLQCPLRARHLCLCSEHSRQICHLGALHAAPSRYLYFLVSTLQLKCCLYRGFLCE